MKKKIFVFGLIIMMVFMTSACKKKMTTYEEITYSEFQEKIKNKESFILFVGSKTCSACDRYKVTLNEIIKDYQVKVYYIDIANFDINEQREFLTIINFSSTPTTVFITNGEEKTVYNRIVGALPYSKIEKKLEKAGYIKVKK